MAVTSAANPDAEEARPAAVGKLLFVSITSGGMSRFVRQAESAALILASSVAIPFSVSVSVGFPRAGVTDVVLASVSRVIDIEGAAGKLPGLSCFPQYFSSAMLGWAVAVHVEVMSLSQSM